MSEIRIAIIGDGMAGHCFIEELLDKVPAGQSDITVFCEEPRIACDRVHLSSYFSHHTAEELSLVHEGFYEKHGIKMLVGERAITINRQEKAIHSSVGCAVSYDELIMATGSYPWIPPAKGAETQDRLVYRTIKDLNAIESCARRGKRSTVVGGGLLGLEATGVLKNLGVKTHVIKLAPVLMAEQFGQMSDERLQRKIESMDVKVHTGKNTKEIVQQGTEACETMYFADSNGLQVDFIVSSTGIHLCDKLTTQCGLAVAQCGDIMVNDSCQVFDPDTYAIGEYANQNDRVYGLVAPDYKMVRVAVNHLLGSENGPTGADLNVKLKLLGADVSGIGDAHNRTPGARSYVYLSESKEVYRRLTVSTGNRASLSAVLVGDTSDYDNLLQLALNTIELPKNPGSLILPAHAGSGKPLIGVDKLPDGVQICSCFDVSKGDLIVAISKGYHTVAALKAETKTGTGCGGCIPLVMQVLNAELAKQDIGVNNNLCEHFAHSRQELSHLIRVGGIKTSNELLEKRGRGYGCEICKPATGSLLTSCWNEYILEPQHTPLQDTNDNSLANIQKGGTCSVIPRSAGGEVTPEGLVAMGCAAREFNPYIKITGSRRIGLSGAQRDDLPEIWRQLTEAGSEAGRAYTKTLQMMKTCADSTWYRYKVGDSVGSGVELGSCYRGIRTPYEMKLGVSGCTRECVEVQGENVGIIATEKGWNPYTCGNDGMKPCRAGLSATDLDRETPIRYLDRLMMFYVRTADKLVRTASWLGGMEGGIDYLYSVIIDDKLSLNDHLEEELARLHVAFICKWTETVNNPVAQTRSKHFVSSDQRGPNVQMVLERDQHCPVTPYGRISVTLVEEGV